MRKMLMALGGLAILIPGVAGAQNTTTTVPPPAAGAVAPSGHDTPVPLVPGGPAAPTGEANDVPAVDSAGAFQPNGLSNTGAVPRPSGAHRLRGTSLNPPTGPQSGTAPPP